MVFDFERELSFFETSGANPGMAKYFREFSRFKFAQDKLKAENSRIRAGATVSPVLEAQRSPAPQVFGKMPEDLKSLQDKAKRLYKDSVYLHDGLAAADTEARRIAAGQILDNFKTLLGWWEKIDKWAKTGEMPAPETDNISVDLVSADEADLLRRLTNLKTYIAKLKDRIDDKGKAKLADYQQEHDLIKTRLDAF